MSSSPQDQLTLEKGVEHDKKELDGKTIDTEDKVENGNKELDCKTIEIQKVEHDKKDLQCRSFLSHTKTIDTRKVEHDSKTMDTEDKVEHDKKELDSKTLDTQKVEEGKKKGDEGEFSAQGTFCKVLLSACGEAGTGDNILVIKFISTLKHSGLRPLSDIRLRPLVDLFLLNKQGSGERLYTELNLKRVYDIQSLLENAPHSCLRLVKNAILGNFVIPEFLQVTEEWTALYKQIAHLTHGQNASYIPQMARIGSEVWGASVCTIDGQRWSYGDAHKLCTMQSVSGALNYALAISKLGTDVVHEYVGKEPCQNTAIISLDKNTLPHNALEQSGSIAMVSLLLDSQPCLASCFEDTFALYREMAGMEKLKTNNAIYIAEKAQADRKYSIAYFLKEHGVFPHTVKIKSVLDLYFQLCSVEISCDTGAVLAATLANGGVCPTTNKTVLTPTAVQNTLSVMQLNGLYDYSGEWMFEVGIPAKATKSGLVLVVVPGVLGMCLYSAPLDRHGNSVRGVEFTKRVNNRYSFHFLDNHNMTQDHVIRRGGSETQEQVIMNIMYAAAHGDLALLKRYRDMGLDLNVSDYDGRTALHLAACNDMFHIAQFLVAEAAVDASPLDRWNRTPIDDAVKYNNLQIVKLLEGKGAFQGPGLIEVG